jgi:4a-hydroxytetrahydrobiopterin dehydratase
VRERPVEGLDDQLARRRLLAGTPPDAILGVVDVPVGWSESEGALERELTFDDFPAAVDFVNRLAELAEAENHHPDIAICYRRVTVRWTTHSADGITERDRELAGRTNELL